ncbi:hypothetical protein [Flavobacterium sp. CF136]|uniref:hypothetical protein n=1 Tax=Flavobacterium sp. (strain CF136) TaxID=1144313 RepID=UPI0012FBC372|nr:hypothetical protein [Flavobacterium sp. CF136]
MSELKISTKYKQDNIIINRTPMAKLYVYERFTSSLKYKIFIKKDIINSTKKRIAIIL